MFTLPSISLITIYDPLVRHRIFPSCTSWTLPPDAAVALMKPLVSSVSAPVSLRVSGEEAVTVCCFFPRSVVVAKAEASREILSLVIERGRVADIVF